MATILKFSFKNKKKYFRSMRFGLLLLLILVGIVPLVVFNFVFVRAAEKSMIEKRTEILKTQCIMLKNYIISNGDLENLTVSTFDSEISQISSLYDRRVVIIDQSYQIVEDTYNIDQSKYCVSQAVIDAFNDGTDTQNVVEDEDYIEFVMAMSNYDSDEDDVDAVLYVSYSTYDISVIIDDLRFNGSVIIIVFSVLMIITALLLSRKFTKPLEKIEGTIEMISNGRFDHDLKIKGFSETENIATAFNQMLTKIDKFEENRQEFVSNVSHELKTPITSIKVLADSLLMQEDVPTELYREFLQDIVGEIDRENAIITDLLTLVKLDKKSSEINIEKININNLIELVLKRLTPIAAQKNIELTFESYRPVMAEVDETKITIAVSNLVENAIKYNIIDGWVRITLNADLRFFFIKVEDSGMGIPEDEQENVFDRFYRVDKTRARETGGTGLGLAITKNIILMHKGSIKVYSGEDEGTTFTVRIPLNYVS